MQVLFTLKSLLVLTPYGVVFLREHTSTERESLTLVNPSGNAHGFHPSRCFSPASRSVLTDARDQITISTRSPSSRAVEAGCICQAAVTAVAGLPGQLPAGVSVKQRGSS
ncbi:hypothetical protein T310_0083 [Rasamsonia emersonii CBS 393.64]|uniref:Secreted protein n=1 Tax=Rasamsonia emersonii (strain ATCC 16479 / CBS 393.64 / IMI 116815) TaxID=1408163 RepID=A0A0F4Z6C6_RASE3|nr:hypothetical protein T310_0083 [Rasamsonia emersonii CBS 393.64]KKA25880.1 hypothetical protein T310_0083 [Rasamsonia emersonii CBS 393.64]